jgi:hypothetical protein
MVTGCPLGGTELVGTNAHHAHVLPGEAERLGGTHDGVIT